MYKDEFKPGKNPSSFAHVAARINESWLHLDIIRTSDQYPQA